MPGVVRVIESAPALILSRWLLGGVFIYASLHKIYHPDQFAQIVLNYKLMPDTTINLLAIFMPWLELIAGLFLVLGIWVREGATILAALLLVFIGAIGFNLARGLDFNCGCFTTSADHESASYWTLVRDIALLIPAIHLMLCAPARQADRKDLSSMSPRLISR